MRASAWTAATLAWMWLMAAPCLAGQVAAASEPAAQEKAGKELHALRITGTPPRIDGRLDDEAWTKAAAISDLVQEDPDNMVAPTERTIVRVTYDDRYLYVAVEMFMKDPSRVRDGLGRRGSAPPTDGVIVMLDTSHDHLNAYIFEVNASGVQNDFLMVNDTNVSNDYEAVWEVATAR